MSTLTINTRNSGDTITSSFFNDLQSALGGDFVGRNSSGVATAGQNLGTVALPWGTVNCSGLNMSGTSIDPTTIVSPTNRIISGKLRSTSNQPMFIKPNGAAASFLLEGASTNLKVDINGATVTVSTDITKSSLTLAPAATNTCLVNDAAAIAQDDTRYWGESNSGKPITVNTMGANVSALVGKFAAFKIGTEYFLAYVESTTILNRCMRGFFYDSSYAPLNRTTFSTGATITLMSLGWVFIENNATTIDVSYTNPTWSQASPSSPVTGDYWYDESNNVWKRYDGASFQIINRTLIGLAVIDTANCVAARSFDFYAQYSSENTAQLKQSTSAILAASGYGQVCSVLGKKIVLNTIAPWNITTDLAAAADMNNSTEQASTDYYFYLSDQGHRKISDIAPHWRADLYGFYHPHNPWRCIAAVTNDGSSNFTESTLLNYGSHQTDNEIATAYESQAAGTNGGTFTNGAFRTRTLNTLTKKAGLKWIVLASNRLFLAPGSYEVTWRCPANIVDTHVSKLVNITDTVDEIIGAAAYAATANAAATDSMGYGTVSLAVHRNYEVQHRSSATSANTSGLGLAANLTLAEIYSTVRIRRLR